MNNTDPDFLARDLDRQLLEHVGVAPAAAGFGLLRLRFCGAALPGAA